MRCELTDHERTAIKLMLPNKPRDVPRVNGSGVLKRHLVGIGRELTLPSPGSHHTVCGSALMGPRPSIGH